MDGHEFNADDLPSNEFKNIFEEKIQIDELKSHCESSDDKFGDIEEWVTKYNPNIILSYNIINKTCTSKNNNAKCCRYINYYIDHIIDIINSSHLRKEYKERLSELIENLWEGRLNSSSSYNCTREKQAYSTVERCILKQIYDFLEDKETIQNTITDTSKTIGKYNEYLKDKFCSIYKNNKYTIEKKYINIHNDSDETKSVQYNKLPLSYEFLNSMTSKKNNNFTVSISNEKPIFLISDGGQKQLKALGSSQHQSFSPQEDSKSGREETYASNFSLLHISSIIVSTFLGVIFICSILCKFSPLGNKLHNQIIKNKITENMNEEEIQEYLENSQHNQYQVAYNSVPY
ncbi:PIR Superfamily Protein [Plasmodium ovale curtisi]|uniref:PIR Superfamily Protein n=2 Tax=Plasmodium ovale curtisi TaxID=864141 RepID=A0A1A8W8Z8_PLAOA|nr:PIR Superfamily Protein [Plasmodium ovale curtisi]